MQTWYYDANGYGGMQWKGPIYFIQNDVPQYEALIIFIASATRQPKQLAVTFKDGTVSGSATPNVPLDKFTNRKISVLRWTRIVVPLNSTLFKASGSKNYNTFWVQNNVDAGAQIYFAAYFGAIPEEPAIATVTAPPPVPTYTFDADDYYLTWEQTLLRPDTGQWAQWRCSQDEPTISLEDMFDVNIQAFRRLVYAKGKQVPMIIHDNALLANGEWTIYGIWGSTIKVDAQRFPHPALVCALHNADYFIIGNRTQASRILVAWMPDVAEDIPHAIGAYATYVKRNKKDGKDQVAVFMQVRYTDEFYSWKLSTLMPFDCRNNLAYDDIWKCPDHIFFRDSQMGVMHHSLDRLLELSTLEEKYFKKTGFKASMEVKSELNAGFDVLLIRCHAKIYPIVKTITNYNEISYALPFGLVFDNWFVNSTNIQKLGLDSPPPNGNWGSSWWRAWNLQVFQTYIDKMLEAGLSDILTLPAGVEMTETKFANYLGYTYGASVLDSKGRCGLDENMERALTETIVKWRQQTNWEHYNDTSKFPNTGVLQWRGTYSPLWPEFQAWMNAEPKDDPRDEPYMNYADASSNQVPNTAWLSAQPGFTINQAYGSDMMRIYPPTGVASVRATLIGINKFVRNPEFAYEALMQAFATNERYQTNAPAAERNGRGGVSGYTSVAYSPMYKISGKTFYSSLLEHAMFVGSPVAQSPSYGEIESANPVQLAFNDILYKKRPVKEALQRACVIINNLTRPACSRYEMVPYLEEDPKTNQATLKYKWADNKTECRDDVAGAQILLSPIANVVSTPYVSGRSHLGKTMMAIAIVGIIIDVVLLALFVVKRHHPVIRAASKSFSFLILFGGITALSSVLMRTVSDKDLGWASCFGPYWFFAIGYALVLGSLFVKTYRIDRIFRNKEIGFKINDLTLFSYLGIIVAVEIFLLLLLQFWLSDHREEVEIVIDFSSGMTVKQRQCPAVHMVPSALLYIWNALLIVAAATFSYRTRHVSSAYNENIFTVAAIGVISVVSIVIVPVLQITSSSVAAYLLICLGTVLGAVIPILIFAIPKLLVAFDIMTFTDELSVMSVRPHSEISDAVATGRRTAETGKTGHTVTVGSFRKKSVSGIRKSRTMISEAESENSRTGTGSAATGRMVAEIDAEDGLR
ncbi:Gamma-aminobutyric acid type B receptor subunit 2 [Rhizophlyctis rosea]|uniref:Gamma-aminobutyric acid type B receptor subunit 2 n=1 Tax=Rhizophlyctis rosea TaxID=64517 RepID=A0AAD5SAA1_9FUNG|nr:Gamma-aminobutyric acid type B receptor subunit 2 [Rhizophlyctis rosea]